MADEAVEGQSNAAASRSATESCFMASLDSRNCAEYTAEAEPLRHQDVATEAQRSFATEPPTRLPRHKESEALRVPRVSYAQSPPSIDTEYAQTEALRR